MKLAFSTYTNAPGNQTAISSITRDAFQTGHALLLNSGENFTLSRNNYIDPAEKPGSEEDRMSFIHTYPQVISEEDEVGYRLFRG